MKTFPEETLYSLLPAKIEEASRVGKAPLKKIIDGRKVGSYRTCEDVRNPKVIK